MATRKHLRHDEKTRAKIQASQLINRLKKHILAKPEEINGKWVVKDLMTQSQVTAALGLIKKVLPDLQAIEMKAEVTETKRIISSEPLTTDEWERKYGDNLEASSRPAKSLN